MKKNNGIQWPIGIALALLGVVGLGTWTILETSKEPVEESGIYMRNYQTADAQANDIINATIAFNKKYTLEYLAKQLHADDAKVQYKITTKAGEAVNNAQMKVIFTRPESHDYDITLDKPAVKDGIYTFETKLPKIGRWDVLAEIKVGDNKRYYNFKTDTRFDKKPIVY